jgi:hypothetical protein
LYPIYAGIRPGKIETDRSIWFTSSDQLSLVSDNIKRSLWGIILIDNDESELSKLDFKMFQTSTPIPEPLTKVYLDGDQYMFKRFANANEKSYATNNLTGTNYLAGYGILTDQYIGDWWISSKISPCRQHYLKSFFNWLNNHSPVSHFEYPPSSVEVTNQEWVYKNILGKVITTHMSIRPDNYYPYVYLGARQWCLHHVKDLEQYMYCGLELSDDQHINLNKKIVAKTQ